eukprot:CAMPEP_0201911678 /NCGR_PEP_ID=MMETSP0903-20130614/2547_1 /ASSEMBLY_ACC=CAM_ASM_000552 /TAXON_ID=420261 /ORGANISM="Thalassiosira antarctica, Strain CCMP982" /LENGTH=484 /DNA_ID=CAMNT_0048446447 /DNA_START=96 /DNA_END=1547 /DNA_ORIENTATION=-
MSNADDDEENDCPLCLLPLESYDHSHPLQCPSRHCHFNCCMDCLERMIQSTKDDHTEASDGNTFRVFLHCPICRSNLGPSIRDTLLLRKVDKYSHRVFDDELQVIVIDDELSASELSLKYALEKDDDVALAVEGARNREDDFFGRDVEMDVKSFDNLDAVLGKSFMEDFCEVLDEPKQLEDVEADSTLLCGLDAFMTDQEQKFMTAQLISGDTSRLAAVTEMMHYVSALSRQGIKPNLKRRKRSMLESIKEIIREGNEARRLEAEREARNAKTSKYVGVHGTSRKNKKGQVDMERKKQIEYMEVKTQMEYMKLHPLPLRMPKYAEVTTNKAGLTFCGDTWDGTILDAFSKITVNKSLLGHITVTKQHAESSGIRRVIDAGSPKSNGKGYIDTEKPRVIIASINRDLGQQGVVKGDVVSHFNGEPFMGTASELTELIDNRYEGEVLTFAFNADGAVAEALKRRSTLTRTMRENSSYRRPSRRPIW